MADAHYYPFRWWQFFGHRARLRRHQLSLSIARMKQPVPYARFLYSTATVWFVANFVLFFFNWILPGLILQQVFWIFAGYMAISGAYVMSVWLYAWVNKHWPTTIKWQIGNAYPISVRSYTVGERVDSIEIYTTDPSVDPAAQKARVDVELSIGGGVNDLPFPDDKGPVMVARASFKDKKGSLRAGILVGKTYLVPCKPEFYVLGDMMNWRGVDWSALIGKHFKGMVNDFTRVILATDPMDPETWELPETPGTVIRELYEAKARIHQLERDLGDYVMEDRIRRGGQEDEAI